MFCFIAGDGFTCAENFAEFLRVALLGEFDAAEQHAAEHSNWTREQAREAAQVIYDTGKELRAELRAADAEDSGEGGTEEGVDEEVAAIAVCQHALRTLTDDARDRALDYLCSRADAEIAATEPFYG